MNSKFRVLRVAVGGLAAFAFVACSEAPTLPTTVDPVAMQADVDAVEAAFSAPVTASFTSFEVGLAIDNAMAAAGGAAVRYQLPAMMLAEGPVRPLERLRHQIRDAALSPTADLMPLTALGKTFEYNTTSDEYEPTARPGAPATGVRFILYTTDGDGLIIEPLVEVGYVDLTRSSVDNKVTGRAEIYGLGGTKVMDYTITIGGTTNFPTFSVVGFAGVGVNQVTFNLATGYSLVTQNVTINWRTDMVARGLSSRVQLAIGGGPNPQYTLGAVMRNGLRKVEIGGTGVVQGAGDFTVKVGNRVFALVEVDALGNVTITDPNGGPLSPADELTMFRIFIWFEAALYVPDALLGPLFVILDIDI